MACRFVLALVILAVAPAVPASDDAEAGSARLYWSTALDLRRTEPDGNHSIILRALGDGPFFHFGGMALDPVEGKIYWSQGGFPHDDVILRGDADSCEVVVPDQFYVPPRIELDALQRKLYWSEFDGTYTLRRANLDGSGQEIVYSSSEGQQIGGFTIDSVRETIFFFASEASQEQIFRLELDGSDAELIYSVSVGVQKIRSVATDSATGKLYWIERHLSDPSFIRRTDPDGSNVETVLSDPGRAQSLAIDPVAETIYWQSTVASNPPYILRANFDGSGVQIVTGSGREANAIRVNPSGNFDIAKVRCAQVVPAAGTSSALLLGLGLMAGCTALHVLRRARLPR